MSSDAVAPGDRVRDHGVLGDRMAGTILTWMNAQGEASGTPPSGLVHITAIDNAAAFGDGFPDDADSVTIHYARSTMAAEVTQRRQVISDLAVVLHQALRGPGYLPIRPRDAVMRLKEDLGIADVDLPEEIESKLATALEGESR